MARYWVYLNDQVKGPFELDQLIRLPGFSRQTMVSMDTYTGTAGKWISPAEIPELARIFQKVDELNESPTAVSRPAPKPAKPKIPLKLTPVAPPVIEQAAWYSHAWVWMLLLALLAGGGVVRWTQINQHAQGVTERQAAQTMIETAPLPPMSEFSTLRQYLQTKQISSRWEFERTQTGLYNVHLSWLPAEKLDHMPVYAFEVNLQAQSLRGLNSAAIQLLSEGFPAARSLQAKSATAKPASSASKKSPGDYFPSAVNDRRQAFEQGDFETVWQSFSKRRQTEMEQGGIGRASFVRMQRLTYRQGSGIQQDVMKTKPNSDTERMVLLRQSQPKHPDIYIKQRWVWEDNAWRLDDEEKKIAAAPGASAASSSDDAAPASPASPAASPTSPAPSPSNPPTKQTIPSNLPGLSDTFGTAH